jgi:hypothetical protein
MKNFKLKLLSICIIVSCVVAARPVAGITVISQSPNTYITLGYTGQLEFENPLSGTETVQGYDILDWRDADYSAGPPRWYDDWSVSHPAQIDGDASRIWMRTQGHSIWTSTTVASTIVSIHMDGDDNDGLAQVIVDGAEVARLDMLTPPGPGNALIIVKNLQYALHTITINDIGISPGGGQAWQKDVSTLGAAALSKPLVEHSKWSQPPIEINPQSSTPMYWGWDEPSFRESEPIWFDAWDCRTQCHGDADCDGKVHTEDLVIVKSAFGTSYPNPNYDPRADFNRDLHINAADVAILESYFGKDPPADCGQNPQNWMIVADDFRCLGSMPITSIHWWGSYIGWQEPEPPPVKPTSWRIGFWSNVPPMPPGGFSHPGKLLWQIEVDASRVNPEMVGYDEFPDTIPETCFQYYVQLKPEEYFRQAKQEPNTVDSIFWLSIAAIYPPGPLPNNLWGWKTRPWHWMDDAVTFTIQGNFGPGYVLDPSMIRPLEIGGESYDAAFELDTDPNYIKWEQSYTGSRSWPHYEDVLSMATTETIVEPITKWYQKPDTSEAGIDVDAYEDIWRPQILADDFPCTKTGPITDIHIWGSWYHDHPPFGDPTQVIFTLSIHENIPANDPRYHNPYSMPGQVLWTKTFLPGQFGVTQYATTMEGWFVPCSKPQYYDPYADNICWFYSFNINPTEAFIQQQGKIYWLDVQAQPMHEPGFPEPIRFGWKDSTNHYQDNAVYAVGQEPIGVPGPWQPMWYPPGHPYAGNKIDLAFRITTQGTPPIKYNQEPDLQTPFSIDIDATKDQVWQPQVLADDFQCTSTDPITDIHLWGSWYHDMIPYGDPNKVIFKLSIRADIPANQSPTGYSMPGTVLWEREFQPGEFKATLFASNLYEGYLAPCSEPPYYEPYGDSMCWQYDFVIDPREAFVQQGSTTNPVVYWLSVQARQVPPAAGEPIFPMRSRFGWKTTPIEYHWNDDAVWSKDGGVTWNELRYPGGHPYMGTSADLAFEITSQKTHQEFVLHQVADDWRCQGRTPVTAAVWWGSYIGYRYETYQGVQIVPPTKPDYFLLSIWTDVPANTPGDPYPFSHPGTKVWEYKATKYDEVLVGYDKHPEPTEQGPGFEPVFRYSVRLPQTSWYLQKNVNEVFWFSVVAVYDVNRYSYPWGWTNHKHVFNDDAVSGQQSPTGGWIWEELYDQTPESEDMSFILFTEPGCFPSSYTTYFDWLTLGKPNCWCGIYWTQDPDPAKKWRFQCDGDADGKTEGAVSKYRISANDLNIVIANWKKKITDLTLDPCADIDHKYEGSVSKYRVSANDLNIVIANWKKKDSGLPGNCVRPE